ncbi:MAG: hypothetical protein ABR936_11945 [Bacteroidota bacterium]|jgi:hypothetical protein
MTFLTSGGTGTVAKLLNDLKIKIAFNHFTGDNFISTIFPNANKDADGNYEIVVYTPGTSGSTTSSILKSITVESARLEYFLYGAGFLFALFVVWMFARK